MITADQTPIDKLAAIVTRPGPQRVSVITRAEDGQAHLREQMRIRLAYGPNATPPPRAIKDWRGVKIGRLTVVCFLHTRRTRSKIKHYWIVKCTCGEYEVRKNDSLGDKDPNRTGACCMQCMRCMRRGLSPLP